MEAEKEYQRRVHAGPPGVLTIWWYLVVTGEKKKTTHKKNKKNLSFIKDQGYAEKAPPRKAD